MDDEPVVNQTEVENSQEDKLPKKVFVERLIVLFFGLLIVVYISSNYRYINYWITTQFLIYYRAANADKYMTQQLERDELIRENNRKNAQAVQDRNQQELNECLYSSPYINKTDLSSSEEITLNKAQDIFS